MFTQTVFIEIEIELVCDTNTNYREKIKEIMRLQKSRIEGDIKNFTGGLAHMRVTYTGADDPHKRT